MKTFVIPIVIGSLGCVSKRFQSFYRSVGVIVLNTYVLQKSVLHASNCKNSMADLELSIHLYQHALVLFVCCVFLHDNNKD